MIDKELIRQAAEDIDLFEDNLSAEFDRLSQQRTRTGNVSPFTFANGQNVGLRGLWPYVAAACIALLLAVGISLRLLMSNPNGSGSLASGHVNTTQDTGSGYGRNLAQIDATTEEKLIGASTFADGSKVVHPQTDTMPNVPPTTVKAGNTIVPITQALAMTSADSQKAEEVPQEEDGYSEALLYALITEVESKAMAEQAEEERLYQTLIEEISTNISKEINQTELTL